MADSIKTAVGKAGDKIAETATRVGHRISEGVEKATDWAKEKLHQGGNRAEEAAQRVKHAAQESCCGTATSTDDIQEHMDVVGSCGNLLGTVDRVEGNAIKLTKSGSPDGRHHFIPLSWVARVDDHVHLSKNCGEAKRDWQTV